MTCFRRHIVLTLLFIFFVLLLPSNLPLHADDIDDALREAGVEPAPSGLELIEKELPEGGLGASDDLFKLFGEKAGFSPSAPSEPEVVIGKLIQSAILLIGVVFGILVIYGGYLWMTARGNEEQAKKAMDILKTAVVGFILVIAAYAITNFVVDEIISAAFTP